MAHILPQFGLNPDKTVNYGDIRYYTGKDGVEWLSSERKDAMLFLDVVHMKAVESRLLVRTLQEQENCTQFESYGVQMTVMQFQTVMMDDMLWRVATALCNSGRARRGLSPLVSLKDQDVIGRDQFLEDAKIALVAFSVVM